MPRPRVRWTREPTSEITFFSATDRRADAAAGGRTWRERGAGEFRRLVDPEAGAVLIPLGGGIESQAAAPIVSLVPWRLVT